MGVEGRPALVGRKHELARLEAFLVLSGGGPATLVLEGEAGIGKTTLWRAGVEHARELGFRILASRPAAPERELPFAVLGDLFAAAHEEIGGLPAPQRRALRIALLIDDPEGEPADARAIGVAALELLRRLATDIPLLVALDDLPCIDSASASVLQFALRRLVSERVGVLATSRGASGAPVIAFEEKDQLDVGPLSLEALDQLVTARLGARFLRPTLQELERASGGNPFYALEIAAGIMRFGGQLEPGEPLPIPGSLRDLVRDRLATLSAGGHAASLAAAALAQPTAAAVEAVGGVGSDGIDEAVRAGVLVRDGGALRLAHPLLAAGIYEDSSPAERVDVHRRLARIVADPHERALHLAEAADGPDEIVAASLETAAANAAARGSADTAARLARRAAELTPNDGCAHAHRRRLARARYVLAAGDPRHAEALLVDELARATAGTQRAQVALELGKATFATRGSPTAGAWFQRALHELEASDDAELRTLVLVELAGIQLEVLELGPDIFEQALALAEQTGNPELLSRALGLYASRLDLCGQPPSKEYWQRALAVEEASGELRLDGPTSAYGATLAFFLGEAEAGALLMRRVADSMRRRSDPLLPIQLLNLSDAARNAGAWADADRYIEEATALVDQTGRDSLAPNCLVYEGRMAMLHGDLEVAREKVEQGLELIRQLASSDDPPAARDELPIEGLAHSVLGRAALQAGRLTEAHRWIGMHMAHLRAMGDQATLAEALAENVVCLLALGELDKAARDVAELDQLAQLTDALGMSWVSALAARSRARVAAARGDVDSALADFDRALELLESLPEGWPYELARTLLAQGSVQRRARQKLLARTTLERALEIFDRLGARLWAEKTGEELRLISGRPMSRGRLTETEQQIADLVAAGRSNAEVAHELSISPKTVEWNLSKVYKKLHVRSRTELAARLSRQTVPS